MYFGAAGAAGAGSPPPASPSPPPPPPSSPRLAGVRPFRPTGAVAIAGTDEALDAAAAVAAAGIRSPDAGAAAAAEPPADGAGGRAPTNVGGRKDARPIFLFLLPRSCCRRSAVRLPSKRRSGVRSEGRRGVDRQRRDGDGYLLYPKYLFVQKKWERGGVDEGSRRHQKKHRHTPKHRSLLLDKPHSNQPVHLMIQQSTLSQHTRTHITQTAREHHHPLSTVLQTRILVHALPSPSPSPLPPLPPPSSQD